MKDLQIMKRKCKKIQKRFGYYFIRINPDKLGFDDYEEFGTGSSYIAKSIKKQAEEFPKKSLIDDLSKMLLGLEFKSNHSIKWKCF